MNPLILAIESSCDETGASVYQQGRGVCSNVLFSQVVLHSTFGGVVPEVASRSHLEKINGIVQTALDDAHVTLADIDVVAVTTRPGLPGSLLVGVCFAKALAACAGKKLIGIDHVQAHIFSSCIEHAVPFPHICLLTSGGNTALYYVRGMDDVVLLGSTLDDAVGEAFDKVAKVLGLAYPGGPVIEQYARQAHFVDFFKYPRSKLKTLSWSFSGLKTAVLYDLERRGAYDLATKRLICTDEELKQHVASSLLVCIADILCEKVNLSLQQYSQAQAVTFVGGVAGNRYLQERLQQACAKAHVGFFVPALHYCTDNAAMVAFLANHYARRGLFSDLTLDVD